MSLESGRDCAVISFATVDFPKLLVQIKSAVQRLIGCESAQGTVRVCGQDRFWVSLVVKGERLET